MLQTEMTDQRQNSCHRLSRTACFCVNRTVPATAVTEGKKQERTVVKSPTILLCKCLLVRSYLLKFFICLFSILR